MAQTTANVVLSPIQREALQRFAVDLAASLPQDVLEVRLFGLRARGDANPWSDVDVLVVARDEPAAERVNQAILPLKQSDWPDDFPSLICVVLEEPVFRHHQATRSLLYRDLRDQGVLLWQDGADLWNEDGMPVMGREEDVRFHISQAEEALKGAQILLKSDLFGRAAANAYYAAFHSASAARTLAARA